MPIGAGVYDKECTAARVATGAKGTVLLVLNGNKGSGFSVQTNCLTMALQLPDQLESIAAEIRRSHGEAVMDPVPISQAKSHLFILRGLVAEKNVEDREKIEACIKDLHDLHAKYGDFIIPATAIFSCECSVKTEKELEELKNKANQDA